MVTANQSRGQALTPGRTMRRLFLGVLLVVGLACDALGQRSVVAEFPFQFRDGLIWLQASIPRSRQPLQFLLDSGAGVSVVNLCIAKRLHLRLGKPVIVEGVETVSKGYWPQFLAVSIGGLELPEEYLAVDLRQLSRACQRTVDGLVGADFFSRHPVRIDFAARAIQVLDVACPARTSDIVRLESLGCGLRIPINVNDGPDQWVRLDTGCAAALEWVTSTVAPDRCSNQIAVALAGLSRPLVQTSLRMGKVDLASVPTGLHVHEMFPGESGLIGNGVLSRFATVTIDLPGGRLILDQTRAD